MDFPPGQSEHCRDVDCDNDLPPHPSLLQAMEKLAACTEELTQAVREADPARIDYATGETLKALAGYRDAEHAWNVATGSTLQADTALTTPAMPASSPNGADQTTPASSPNGAGTRPRVSATRTRH